MESLSITNPSEKLVESEGNIVKPSDKIQGDVVETSKVKKGRIIQKNYILNDSGALKKKKKHESRKEPFNLGVEARDGSNMVIEMKTSFFEYVKASFVNALAETNGIESVENGVASKAPTENSGVAVVEYSLDIAFKVQDKTLVTKLTAYTTSCRIMFQPVGGSPQIKAHLGNKSIPRYFVDTFFLPWCEAAYAKKNYDEKEMIDAINDEIKRLDTLKLEAKKGIFARGRLASVASSEVRCIAKGCKYTGLNSNNKSAVGVCARCSGFEHFECSKTKQEDREEIQKGGMKYYCSLCFMKNPSSIAFDSNKFIKGPISPPRGIIQVTSTTKAVPLPTPIDPKIIFKCKNCEFETETNEQFQEHERDTHSFQCTTCEKVFTSKSEIDDHTKKDHTPVLFNCDICNNEYSSKNELETHKESSHVMIVSDRSSCQQGLLCSPTYPCSGCKEIFLTAEDLNVHLEGNHMTKCPLCDLKFSDNDIFSSHIKNDHAPTCSACNKAFTTKTELEDHIEKNHSIQNNHNCALCENQFNTDESLKQHNLNEHVKCTWCKDMLLGPAELKIHEESKHNIKCTQCDFCAKTETDLREHMNNHSIPCPMCPKKCHDIEEFSNHFKMEHIVSCDSCEKEYGTRAELEEHVKTKHTHVCNVCKEIFGSKPLLRKHTDENHPCKCTVCEEIFGDNSKLTVHMEAEHAYECEKCNFKGNTIAAMESHILDNHVTPDNNNMFVCDDCPFKCKTRELLGKHFQEIHKDNTSIIATDGRKETDTNEDPSKIKEELRMLKNNFERLESMFQDSLEEVDKVRSEYEAKLIEANDKFRNVKAENEELKEKVDVLFKLGRSYINKKERILQDEKNEKKEAPGSPEEEIETISIDEVTEEEDLPAWTKNKLRGFKRVSPAAPSAPKANYVNKAKTSPKAKPEVPERMPTAPEASTGRAPPGFPPVTPGGRKQYCHYFVNQGKCIYEEKTGERCRFAHEQAPMCRSGLACDRNKCMYSHPRVGGKQNMHFLDKSRGYQQMMNPWPMMNPWMNPNPFQQFPNPWGMDGNQSKQ